MKTTRTLPRVPLLLVCCLLASATGAEGQDWREEANRRFGKQARKARQIIESAVKGTTAKIRKELRKARREARKLEKKLKKLTRSFDVAGKRLAQARRFLERHGKLLGGKLAADLRRLKRAIETAVRKFPAIKKRILDGAAMLPRTVQQVRFLMARRKKEARLRKKPFDQDRRIFRGSAKRLLGGARRLVADLKGHSTRLKRTPKGNEEEIRALLDILGKWLAKVEEYEVKYNQYREKKERYKEMFRRYEENVAYYDAKLKLIKELVADGKTLVDAVAALVLDLFNGLTWPVLGADLLKVMERAEAVAEGMWELRDLPGKAKGDFEAFHQDVKMFVDDVRHLQRDIAQAHRDLDELQKDRAEVKRLLKGGTKR